MILKASERGGAKQLAQHLLRLDENEHVEVHDLRGFVSDDLTSALKEAYAVSKGTRCKNFLFSVSLNPPDHADVPIPVFEDTIARIEAKLGLETHARAIVFHEKEGRRHAQVVWSRIDVQSMTARNMPHFKIKLRDIARQLYLEQNWKMPQGLMNSRARDPRNFTLAEWQEWKRKGIRTQDIKTVLQDCWAVSGSKVAFEHALKDRGFLLAKGTRRGFVAVFVDGTVVSVPRYVGKTTKEVRGRLGDPERLHGVDEAKARLSQEISYKFRRFWKDLRARSASSNARHEAARKAMAGLHQNERDKLKAALTARQNAERMDRAKRLKSGLTGLWQRLTGDRKKLLQQNEAEAWQAHLRDRAQWDDLIAAQLAERRHLQREIKHARRALLDQLLNLRIEQRDMRQRLKPSPQSNNPQTLEDRFNAHQEKKRESRKPKRSGKLKSSRTKRRSIYQRPNIEP